MASITELLTRSQEGQSDAVQQLYAQLYPEIKRVARARLAGVGIDTGDIVRGDFGAIARIDDPEGNRITLAEPPSRG